jgi:hypothetical protein
LEESFPLLNADESEAPAMTPDAAPPVEAPVPESPTAIDSQGPPASEGSEAMHGGGQD